MTTFAETPTAASDLGALLTQHRNGYALDAPFYVSQDVFDADISAVFARCWIFVATEAEIREPGDFVTLDIGRYSVIVVRGDDGQVRALHNVCRHRGSRVLTDASGSVGNIVCGYHQWTYDTDGKLLHAGSQAPSFDPNCFGLKRIHARSVGGLVFVCLAEEPPEDFEDMVQRVTPYITPHQLERTKVAAQEDLIETGNWKLVMENNRECYHCENGHPELVCTFFPTWGYSDLDQIPERLLPAHARYLRSQAELERACRERDMPYAEIEEISGRVSAFRIQREPLDGAGESYTRDGSSASHKLLADFDTPRLGRMSLHHQPNSWFHLLADHAVTFTVLPLAPDRTLVRTTWLVHEDAVEGVDYDLATLTDVWHQTNAQDGIFVSRAQAGVSSPAYEPGPYAPNEYQVAGFVTWYLERMTEALTR